jgi:hypothetical protein
MEPKPAPADPAPKDPIMKNQQPAFPPPAERLVQQKPTVRHWDGNGWTQPTPTAGPAAAALPRSAGAAKRGRKAS